MPLITFKEEWDELCPIYIEDEDMFEQIGTGVLINIFNNIYLLTASYVIDELYKSKDNALLIPTVNGFDSIAGTLYHKHLQENENRADDKIDFSFYKLSEEMINVLHKNFIPLAEDKINFSDDYTVEHTTDINEMNKILNIKKVPNMMKKMHEEENYIDKENVDKLNKIICEATITFAGFPNTKSKERNGIHSGEIVYYRGRGLSKQEYITHSYEKSINILAEFGKYGTMNKNFISYNSPKPQGISGGGVYKIIETENSFDRVLIGIGHT